MLSSVRLSSRSNFPQPDLPLRILRGIPLVKGNRETYYTPGPAGYIDYPTAEEAAAGKESSIVFASL